MTKVLSTNDPHPVPQSTHPMNCIVSFTVLGIASSKVFFLLFQRWRKRLLCLLLVPCCGNSWSYASGSLSRKSLIFLYKTVPQTDTGEQVDKTKAYEITTLKELGKFTLYLRKKGFLHL